MSNAYAQANLEQAMTALDAGISAHVAALVAARQLADQSAYLDAMTARVNALTATVALSTTA